MLHLVDRRTVLRWRAANFCGIEICELGLPLIRHVGTAVADVAIADRDGDVVFADSRTLIGQLTFQLKDGTLGELKELTIQSASSQHGATVAIKSPPADAQTNALDAKQDLG